MCTTFTTRNRAVIFNNYTVETLLVNRDAYCPCGPNVQDYSKRSRLYNPDPKYACHTDLTCHQLDSIPKDQSCGQYGEPQFSCCGGGPPASTIPCTSTGGGCFPPGDNTDCPKPVPPACQRRRIRFPGCCKMSFTYRDLIESMQCCPKPPPCCYPCLPPCPPAEEKCEEGNEDDESPQPEACYSLVVPPEIGDHCGSKLTYDFGPNGITRSVQTRGGQHQICMACQDDCVMLEAHGGPGGCCIGNNMMRIKSKATPFSCCLPSPPCCPSPQPQLCVPMTPCCPGPCPPPPCRNRKRIRCSPFLRTTVGPDIGCGCQSMQFRPPFRNP